MSRVQTITISAGEADQRLDRWLKRRFPHLQQGRIEKMCRKGELRLDGGRVKASTRLMEGQAIRIPPMQDTDRAARPAERTEVSAEDAAHLHGMLDHIKGNLVAMLEEPQPV